MRGAVQVALEEGTQAQWLHDLLVPVVDRVVVCDRRGGACIGRPSARGGWCSCRSPAWTVLRTIPFLGPVRVALLLATLQTPWRFRTKRHSWAYAGLAVVTRSSAFSPPGAS